MLDLDDVQANPFEGIRNLKGSNLHFIIQGSLNFLARLTEWRRFNNK